MGRWGSGIYESDDTLDFFGRFADRLERELAYWMSPEQISDDDFWLNNVLTVIEIMILLDQHDKGSSAYLGDNHALNRWRNTFFSIWDGEWNIPYTKQNYHPRPYSELEYRKTYRSAVASLFDRLETIVHFWVSLSTTNNRKPLATWQPEYPLPYFSVEPWTSKENQEEFHVERFIANLIEYFQYFIIAWLSEEKRSEAMNSDVQSVWAAVDLLGFLCTAYRQSPGVKKQVVNIWREKTILIYKGSSGEEITPEDLEKDPLFRNVMLAFDQLEAVAEQYPTTDWDEIYYGDESDE